MLARRPRGRRKGRRRYAQEFPTSASLKQCRAHDFVSGFTPLTVAALQHNFLRFVQAVTASFGNASSHERRHERACFVGSRRGRHVYCHMERGPRSCVGRISDYCGDLSQAGSFRGVPLQSARRAPHEQRRVAALGPNGRGKRHASTMDAKAPRRHKNTEQTICAAPKRQNPVK